VCVCEGDVLSAECVMVHTYVLKVMFI
jgi:hypothetical protein